MRPVPRFLSHQEWRKRAGSPALDEDGSLGLALYGLNREEALAWGEEALSIAVQIHIPPAPGEHEPALYLWGARPALLQLGQRIKEHQRWDLYLFLAALRDQAPPPLRTPQGTLDFAGPPLVMGILNVTPDSFYDGGRHKDYQVAVERGLAMVAEGADLLDIGGESTRPGAAAVDDKEEARRVVPVIRALARQIRVPLSVDTSKASVAAAALEAGASLVNDVTGLAVDPQKADLVRQAGGALVVMHMRGNPRTMQRHPVYQDLLGQILTSLAQSLQRAREAGLEEDRVVVDPGLGFGKTYEHNLEILRRLGELRALGRPLLVGPSRKAFIGKALGHHSPQDRIWGTASAVAVASLHGADMIRVHDVAAMADVARMAHALRRQREERL